jgi:ornithine cyclodeaminase/alanine dehydrogenase-like protein (mu-crystallin family)
MGAVRAGSRRDETAINDKDVRDVADMPALVRTLEHGLHAEASGPGSVPRAAEHGARGTLFRGMPAMLPAASVLGSKLFDGTVTDGVRYTVMVAEIDTGEVLCVVDAANLTALRTGATGAVATRHLATWTPPPSA